MKIASQYVPQKENKEEIMNVMSQTFTRIGGRSGRWIASVYRISRAIAKMRMKSMGPTEVVEALDMKCKSDKIFGL
jgi:uncharacterized protein YqeY